MYSTISLDGVPSIQRNGRSVLSVWDEDWKFAHELCDLLNNLEDESALFLNKIDRQWLKAIDRAFKGKVQHA